MALLAGVSVDYYTRLERGNLRPDILDGVIEPRRVFDRTMRLDEVAAGYQAMADRTALKILIRP